MPKFVNMQHGRSVASPGANGGARDASQWRILISKSWSSEIEKVQKVEIEKVHKQMARVYQDLENERNRSWSWGSLDPHEMVDAAMRQADKAFKQYEESWRQLEQKGWTGKN